MTILIHLAMMQHYNMEQMLMQYLLACTYPVNSNKMAARLPKGAVPTVSAGDSASACKLCGAMCELAGNA